MIIQVQHGKRYVIHSNKWTNPFMLRAHRLSSKLNLNELHNTNGFIFKA